MFPHGFMVTVERPAGHDDHGNPLTPATPHEIGRCARNQQTTLEQVNGQQIIVTTEQILCDDVDADVLPQDVLVLPDGGRWQVTGEVERFHSPFTGWAPGCVIRIERATSTS